MFKKISKIIFIVLIICLISAFIAGYKYQSKKANYKKEEVNLKFKDLTLETGSLVPTVNDFLESGEVKESSKIFFENVNSINEEKKLTTTFLYKNDKGNLVDKEEALEKDSDILKENYSKEEIIIGIGNYKVIIESENKNYETTLKIVDEESPKLDVQDVKIIEGDKIDINSFIKTCIDNSYNECHFKLLDIENKEIEIPTKVGKHNLKILATDETGNQTEKEVNLTIEKKKQITNSKANTNNNNSNTNSSTNNSNNTKPSTNNSNNQPSNSNSSSNNQADKPWEKLGMTEHHYYNEPMWTWAKVDFSIEKYGTKENCINACREYGLNYDLYKQGKVLFGCRNINSTSGKYLGEMFYTEDLK